MRTFKLDPKSFFVIRSHLEDNRFIYGIKEFRIATGCGLKDAKEACEKIVYDFDLGPASSHHAVNHRDIEIHYHSLIDGLTIRPEDVEEVRVSGLRGRVVTMEILTCDGLQTVDLESFSALAMTSIKDGNQTFKMMMKMLHFINEWNRGNVLDVVYKEDDESVSN